MGSHEDTPPLVGAIVGFGTIAQGHADGYASTPDVRIAGVIDPVAARRQAAEARLPGVRAFASLEELLLEARVDFVDICCPPAWHANYALAALEAGINVLCEKPVVVNTREMSDLVAAFERSTGMLFPCHNYRFSPAMSFLRSTIGQSDFGTIVSGHMRTFRSGHALGVAEWDPHWRRNSTVSGGGIVQDHGWHSVYLACDLVGAAPVAVSCLAGELASHGTRNEDTALMTLYFDDFVRVTIELSWAATYRETTYVVVGTDQSVLVNGDDVVHVRSRGGAAEPRLQRHHIVSDFDDPLHTKWFQQMFQSFRAALADQDLQVTYLTEALVTASVIDAAYRSAENSGQPVDVPLAASLGTTALRAAPERSRHDG